MRRWCVAMCVCVFVSFIFVPFVAVCLTFGSFKSLMVLFTASPCSHRIIPIHFQRNSKLPHELNRKYMAECRLCTFNKVIYTFHAIYVIFVVGSVTGFSVCAARYPCVHFRFFSRSRPFRCYFFFFFIDFN